MDTYSFISENGTIRQIEDLIAKAKNEEQDARLDAIEQTGVIDFYRETETQTNKRWIDGKPIYRRVLTGVNIGEIVKQWVYTGTTLTGASELISGRGLRKTASMSDEIKWMSFRIMPNGQLMYYLSDGISPLVNIVIVEYVK